MRSSKPIESPTNSSLNSESDISSLSSLSSSEDDGLADERAKHKKTLNELTNQLRVRTDNLTKRINKLDQAGPPKKIHDPLYELKSDLLENGYDLDDVTHLLNLKSNVANNLCKAHEILTNYEKLIVEWESNLNHLDCGFFLLICSLKTLKNNFIQHKDIIDSRKRNAKSSDHHKLAIIDHAVNTIDEYLRTKNSYSFFKNIQLIIPMRYGKGQSSEHKVAELKDRLIHIARYWISPSDQHWKELLTGLIRSGNAHCFFYNIEVSETRQNEHTLPAFVQLPKI